ncbi:MAG: hypothetical protein V1706_06945 [Pseudomonadota bacterium]
MKKNFPLLAVPVMIFLASESYSLEEPNTIYAGENCPETILMTECPVVNLSVDCPNSDLIIDCPDLPGNTVSLNSITAKDVTILTSSSIILLSEPNTPSTTPDPGSLSILSTRDVSISSVPFFTNQGASLTITSIDFGVNSISINGELLTPPVVLVHRELENSSV